MFLVREVLRVGYSSGDYPPTAGRAKLRQLPVVLFSLARLVATAACTLGLIKNNLAATGMGCEARLISCLKSFPAHPLIIPH